MNLKRTLAALGVAALVAFPAGATAKNSNSGGKANGPERVQDDGAGKKPKKPKVKTYEFKGQTLTFDLSKAKVKVADVNNDGKRDLADVAAGDRVNVQAKLPRGAVDTSAALPARHYVDKGPAPAPKPDDEAKEPETPAPPTP